ncbi:MFS general substrate transporter [Acaromyces ingoldii]|uniref:MFS general substrate transporter n=1 Tax=Acaromyces ingoldii TaxID=215250 RepID=A0A316YVE2_9BASI|nr:MFS general substrate transporter [Acaromyces ingoldii]PWN92608.1 MFS general substrate transporter [Acaromyces ingoldii]
MPGKHQLHLVDYLDTSEGGGQAKRAAVERRLVRKLDTVMLPLFCLLNFFSYVGRANLGNAKTDGLEKDVGLHGQDYSNIITAFYIVFGFCSSFLCVTTKKFGPRRMIPIYVFGWGLMGTCSAFAKNFGGLLVLRVLLGFFEAGFGSSTILCLSLVYKRDELARRIAMPYVFAALAAAFSGLVSYGVFQINSPVLHGWQILFILEGLLTISCAPLAYCFLPNKLETVWWLTPEERSLAIERMQQDGSNVVDSSFSLKDCVKPFLDVRTYAWGIIAVSYGVSVATMSNFLPQIISRLGYSTVTTNLLTCGPSVWGAIAVFAISTSSDKLRDRSGHLIAIMCFNLIGFSMLYAVSPSKIWTLYGACFIAATGSWVPSVVFHTWHCNNQLDENKRALDAGIFTMCANGAGIITAQTFRAVEKPLYRTNLIATFSFASICIAVTVGVRAWMTIDNRRRDRQEGVPRKSWSVDSNELVDGEKDVRWRWQY